MFLTNFHVTTAHWGKNARRNCKVPIVHVEESGGSSSPNVDNKLVGSRVSSRSFRVRLSRSFASSFSISIGRCLSIQVCGQQTCALSGSCASSAHICSSFVAVAHLRLFRFFCSSAAMLPSQSFSEMIPASTSDQPRCLSSTPS